MPFLVLVPCSVPGTHDPVQSFRKEGSRDYVGYEKLQEPWICSSGFLTLERCPSEGQENVSGQLPNNIPQDQPPG